MTKMTETLETNRMSTAWQYQDTLLAAYNLLINSSIEYGDVLSNNKMVREHPRTVHMYKKRFSSRLYAFYVMCAFKFGEYLDTDKDNTKAMKKESYDRLFRVDERPENLFNMFQIISEWAQKEGPFRTLTIVNDPNKAFQTGFKNRD